MDNYPPVPYARAVATRKLCRHRGIFRGNAVAPVLPPTGVERNWMRLPGQLPVARRPFSTHPPGTAPGLPVASVSAMPQSAGPSLEPLPMQVREGSTTAKFYGDAPQAQRGFHPHWIAFVHLGPLRYRKWIMRKTLSWITVSSPDRPATNPRQVLLAEAVDEPYIAGTEVA